jgi:hypothetical protein
MSDEIRHECGIAYLRLRKSLSFYHQKYGTAFYGLNKLYLLMEKSALKLKNKQYSYMIYFVTLQESPQEAVQTAAVVLLHNGLVVPHYLKSETPTTWSIH